MNYPLPSSTMVGSLPRNSKKDDHREDTEGDG
jgi:hypothetical protein